jgi:hypothetical protein
MDDVQVAKPIYCLELSRAQLDFLGELLLTAAHFEFSEEEHWSWFQMFERIQRLRVDQPSKWEIL